MPTDHFKVLDVVRVSDDGLDEADCDGVVVQVRSYPDGGYAYSVGSVADDDGWAGIYGESQLTATGTVADINDFGPPGDLRMRDLVTIGDAADPDCRGKAGMITGWASESGSPSYLVWVEELGEMRDVPEMMLTPTGERLDPPTARPAESMIVSTTGDVVEKGEYIVMDELSWHL